MSASSSFTPPDRSGDLYTIAEYEDGFWIEKPDPKEPLEECAFVQVEGPWKERKWAEQACKRWNARR